MTQIDLARTSPQSPSKANVEVSRTEPRLKSAILCDHTTTSNSLFHIHSISLDCSSAFDRSHYTVLATRLLNLCLPVHLSLQFLSAIIYVTAVEAVNTLHDYLPLRKYQFSSQIGKSKGLGCCHKLVRGCQRPGQLQFRSILSFKTETPG